MNSGMQDFTHDKNTLPSSKSIDALEKILLSLKSKTKGTTVSPAATTSKDPISDKESSNSTQKNASRVVPNIELFQSSQKVGYYYDSRFVFYRVAYVSDPLQTLSVYEPYEDGTCKEGKYHPATVLESAVNHDCRLAVNAGLFDRKTGECLGMCAHFLMLCSSVLMN